MTRTRTPDVLSVAFVATAWLATLYFWPRLPDPMPIHWGLDGRPDGFAPLPWGGLALAMVSTAVWLVLAGLPRLDPRRAHIEASARSYAIIKATCLAFLALVTWLALAAAASAEPRLPTSFLNVGVGALFMVLGNYLPKLRSNFFVGIRTPWTLSDEEVWARTHRVAGPLMVGLGIVMMAAAWLPPFMAMAVVVVVGMGYPAWAIGYSYWLFRRRQIDKRDG
jgi:uncharacterized membrane protein